MSGRSRRHDPPPRGFRRRLWHAVRHDVGRKLLALLLAVLVWLKLSSMVTRGLGPDGGGLELLVTEVESLKAANAAMQNASTSGLYLVVPRDVIVRNDLTAFKVVVTGSGLTEQVRDLHLSAVIELDERVLADADEKEWTVNLENRALFQSRGPEPEIKDFDVEPDSLTLFLARRAEAEFQIDPLNVTIGGTPREGYAYDRSNILVHPNRVVLSGPKSAIDTLKTDPSALKLAAVDVEGAVIEVSQQVGIDTEHVDRSVRLMTNGGVVEVTVPIRPKDVVKALVSVPVHYAHEDALAARGRRVSEATRTLDLKITGPRSKLNSLNSEDLLNRIWLVFDWKDASLDRASEQVAVFRTDLPEDVRITDPNDRPPEIEYALEEIPAGASATSTDGGETP
ncbi:MAG: YbbR-like domain-containing protein [Planctomycetes bacterium]|nr:YbbR-like domain-containing protein [Planctomycetota bacterium]